MHAPMPIVRRAFVLEKKLPGGSVLILAFYILAVGATAGHHIPLFHR